MFNKFGLEQQEQTNSIFPSVNVIYEEAKNIDIYQLELESERLMVSISKMDQKN